jgi:L-threonylcarbamoyladenylate synthase
LTGGEAEKKERAKSDLAKKVAHLDVNEIAIKAKKEKIFSFFDFSIWVVSGELVRSSLYIDFTAGGHDKVYDFVPKTEVWLDDDLSGREVVYVLIHELHERLLMIKGRSYVQAHNEALKWEFFSRKNYYLANVILFLEKIMNAFLKKEVVLTPEEVLLSDGVGVMPTDTLYGLVASVYSEDAVKRIYDLKGRDSDKGLIVLISSFKDLEIFGIKVSSRAKIFLKKFWPGKLSVVFPFDKTLFPHLDKTGGTLAVRLPDKKDLIKFIKKTGPIVAPSANLQGLAPAKSIEEAQNYFGNNVDFYINGGEIDSLPSTLVKIEGKEIKVLRGGAVTIPDELISPDVSNILNV